MGTTLGTVAAGIPHAGVQSLAHPSSSRSMAPTRQRHQPTVVRMHTACCFRILWLQNLGVATLPGLAAYRGASAVKVSPMCLPVLLPLPLPVPVAGFLSFSSCLQPSKSWDFRRYGYEILWKLSKPLTTCILDPILLLGSRLGPDCLCWSRQVGAICVGHHWFSMLGCCCVCPLAKEGCRNITDRAGGFRDLLARRTPPENEPNHSATLYD